MRIFSFVALWMIGFNCILIMKKIEPNNKIYPIWVLFVLIAFTLVNLFR